MYTLTEIGNETYAIDHSIAFFESVPEDMDKFDQKKHLDRLYNKHLMRCGYDSIDSVFDDLEDDVSYERRSEKRRLEMLYEIPEGSGIDVMKSLDTPDRNYSRERANLSRYLRKFDLPVDFLIALSPFVSCYSLWGHEKYNFGTFSAYVIDISDWEGLVDWLMSSRNPVFSSMTPKNILASRYSSPENVIGDINTVGVYDHDTSTYSFRSVPSSCAEYLYWNVDFVLNDFKHYSIVFKGERKKIPSGVFADKLMTKRIQKRNIEQFIDECRKNAQPNYNPDLTYTEVDLDFIGAK